MSTFSKSIAPFVNQEIVSSKHYRDAGDTYLEFEHLENAHVLGQESTYHHVRVHFLMLLCGIRQKAVKEFSAQFL